MIAALLFLVAGAASPEPTYVVERVVTVGGAVTRISLFRNGMAVLSRTSAGEAQPVVRQPLTPVEVRVLTQVVEECYPELERFAGLGGAPGDATIELRLAPRDRAPLSVRLPLNGVPSVGAARLGKALDGLEARLTRTNVSREDLSDWQPAVGDRAQLEDGRIVEVLDVVVTGNTVTVHVRVGDGPASLFLSDSDLRRMALRRVGR